MMIKKAFEEEARALQRIHKKHWKNMKINKKIMFIK